MIIEYRVNIGNLSFLLTDNESKNIPSMTAIKSADILANSIENTIRDKNETDYGLTFELLNIRRGSWIVDYSLGFRFLASADTVGEFVDKYESIRDNLLSISNNIQPFEITGRVFFKKINYLINVGVKELSLIDKEDVKIRIMNNE